jgi:hypothetical protein
VAFAGAQFGLSLAIVCGAIGLKAAGYDPVAVELVRRRGDLDGPGVYVVIDSERSAVHGRGAGDPQIIRLVPWRSRPSRRKRPTSAARFIRHNGRWPVMVESECDAGGFRSTLSVAAPFVWRCLTRSPVAPVSTPRSSNRTCRFAASGSRTRRHAFTHDGPRPSCASRTSPKCP